MHCSLDASNRKLIQSGLKMNSSKIVLVFCAFAVFSVLAEVEDMHLANIRRCEKKIGVDINNMEKYDKGDPVELEKWRCFPECVMKGNGLMNENGTINKDNIPNVIPVGSPRRDEIIAGLRSCSETAKGTTACEIAASFGDCANEKKLWSKP